MFLYRFFFISESGEIFVEDKPGMLIKFCNYSIKPNFQIKF